MTTVVAATVRNTGEVAIRLTSSGGSVEILPGASAPFTLSIPNDLKIEFEVATVVVESTAAIIPGVRPLKFSTMRPEVNDEIKKVSGS